jgi:hypothetical protein
MLAFSNEYPDSKKFVTNRTFIKWIKKYCEYNKEKYVEGNSNGQRWFMIDNNNNVVSNELLEDPF